MNHNRPPGFCPRNWLSRHLHRNRLTNRRRVAIVVCFALVFAAGNDTLTLQAAELGSDDGEAMFGVAVIAKQHDPFARLPEIMCVSSI